MLAHAEIPSFRRTLDFTDGTLRRDVRWVTPSGKRMRLRTTRLVSLRHRHLAAIPYQLIAEDAEADVVISSELLHRPLPVDDSDPRLAEGFVGRVLHPTGTRCDGLRAILSYRTQSSGLVLGCGMDHQVEGSSRLTTETTCQDDLAAVVLKGVVEKGTLLSIYKYLGYHYSDAADPEQIRLQTGWTLSRAIESGFSDLLDQQRSDMSRFWSRADVKVEGGHPRTQQVVWWNLFQLLQASERVEGHGIGASSTRARSSACRRQLPW